MIFCMNQPDQPGISEVGIDELRCFFGDKLDLLPCFLIQNLWTMTFLRFSCFIVMQSILSRLLVLVTTLILEYIQHIYTSYINSYFVHIIA